MCDKEQYVTGRSKSVERDFHSNRFITARCFQIFMKNLLSK